MAFLFLAWADEPDITVSFSIDVCREKRTESNPVQLVKGQESTYNDLVWGLRATGNTIIHHCVFFHFINIQNSSCVLVRNNQWFTNLENTFSQRLMANLTKSWMWPLIRIEITVPLQSQCVFMSKEDTGQPSFFWQKDKIICITFSKFKKIIAQVYSTDRERDTDSETSNAGAGVHFVTEYNQGDGKVEEYLKRFVDFPERGNWRTSGPEFFDFIRIS